MKDQMDMADNIVSYCSKRVIRKHIQFALLGEYYDRILAELNMKPFNYAKSL